MVEQEVREFRVIYPRSGFAREIVDNGGPVHLVRSWEKSLGERLWYEFSEKEGLVVRPHRGEQDDRHLETIQRLAYTLRRRINDLQSITP